MDDPRVLPELVRNGEAGVPGREENMGEDAPAADLEAAVNRPHALDTCASKAPVPVGLGSQLRDVLEELVHSRVVAVASAP